MGRHSYDEDYRGSGGAGFWFVGLVLGMLGGTAIALLTTPKTGREIRGAIKDTAQTLPNTVNEILDESLDLYASAINHVQSLVEEQTIRFQRAVAAGKLAAAKKREELELGNASVLPFQHR